MDDTTLWYIFAYVVGTGFGYFVGKTSAIKDVAAITIDTLIEGGYLKHRRDANGEIELLKINEEK